MSTWQSDATALCAEYINDAISDLRSALNHIDTTTPERFEELVETIYLYLDVIMVLKGNGNGLSFVLDARYSATGGKAMVQRINKDDGKVWYRYDKGYIDVWNDMLNFVRNVEKRVV